MPTGCHPAPYPCVPPLPAWPPRSRWGQQIQDAYPLPRACAPARDHRRGVVPICPPIRAPRTSSSHRPQYSPTAAQSQSAAGVDPWRAPAPNPADPASKCGEESGLVVDPPGVEPSPLPPELAPLVRPQVDRCGCLEHQERSPRALGIRRPGVSTPQPPPPLGSGRWSRRADYRGPPLMGYSGPPPSPRSPALGLLPIQQSFHRACHHQALVLPAS